MLRRIRIILLSLLALLVLGFGALVVVARVYETEVKVKLVGALNERLKTPVTVSDMDLTLIARFPMASIRMHDVLVKEVRTDSVAPDTLLAAGKLFLEFNLWDLFGGNYTVQQIHASTVRLYPGLDANGAENYLIWKTDSAGAASSPIALKNVSFSDLTLRYRDARSALEVTTQSNALALTGRFSDALSELDLNGDAHLIGWDQKGQRILGDRQANLKLALSFGGADGAFRITHGEVNSGDMPLEVTLDLTRTEKGHDLDLRANGLGLDLAEAALLLPDAMGRRLTRYGMQGEMDLAVRYTGPMEGAGPALSVGAKVVKGRMKEKHSGTTFTDIFGELALELTPNGTPRKVVVKGFSAKSGSGTISGNWRSEGLKNAAMKADMHGDIALADLLRFAGVDTLELVSGHLNAVAHVEGKLRDVADLRASDLRALKITGTASLSDASLKLKGVRHRVEHLNANLALHGNDASIDALKMDLQGSPIELKGELVNLMPYLLFDDQRLAIRAQASSPHIDLAALLLSEEASSAKDYAVVLPAAIDLDLQARVDELTFEDFTATNINGTVRMKDRMLRVSPMAFSTASGAVLGTLQLDGRGGAQAASYPLAIDATIKDIDVTQLFREFKDFGQDFIGYRHLSGRTQAQIAFTAPLSPGMKLDMERTVCSMDIVLENGGIKNHQPLLDIADHLKKNKLVAPFVDMDELRKRLADVRFSRLENRIEIHDGAVHIPMMDVHTTVMDMELSGTHWFDDRIDHHINFRLSDLFRMGDAKQDEFGPIADDGTGMRIFLHMYGTADDPQFENDGALAAEKRKKQFQQEKQELRSILREDIFGKKDGTNANDTGRAAQPRFQVDWDPDSAGIAKAQAPKEKPRKGFGRLIEPAKEEPKEGFHVED
ncbi:MAG: AsmA-like C-terminal region-containing protein [Flavobacteriales bacterium]